MLCQAPCHACRAAQRCGTALGGMTKFYLCQKRPFQHDCYAQVTAIYHTMSCSTASGKARMPAFICRGHMTAACQVAAASRNCINVALGSRAPACPASSLGCAEMGCASGSAAAFARARLLLPRCTCCLASAAPASACKGRRSHLNLYRCQHHDHLGGKHPASV